MEGVEYQVHHKFKVFQASKLADIALSVAQFTRESRVAPKSIGVEYLEGSDSYVVSLGYTTDQDGYAVTLMEKGVGQVSDAAALEQALETAANSVGNVICHEMYVDGNGNVTAVFMLKA
jgi:hypothetical protein